MLLKKKHLYLCLKNCTSSLKTSVFRGTQNFGRVCRISILVQNLLNVSSHRKTVKTDNFC